MKLEMFIFSGSSFPDYRVDMISYLFTRTFPAPLNYPLWSYPTLCFSLEKAQCSASLARTAWFWYLQHIKSSKTVYSDWASVTLTWKADGEERGFVPGRRGEAYREVFPIPSCPRSRPSFCKEPSGWSMASAEHAALREAGAERTKKTISYCCRGCMRNAGQVASFDVRFAIFSSRAVGS